VKEIPSTFKTCVVDGAVLYVNDAQERGYLIYEDSHILNMCGCVNVHFV
jgi:hypothetical protein